MSQIRCYLVLTMILALGYIIECRTTIRSKKNNKDTRTKKNNEDSRTKENNEDISTRNKAEPFENCVYEYRVNVPSHCDYGVSFGKLMPDNEKILQKVYSRGTEIKFSTTDEWEINDIFVEDNWQSKHILDDGLHITEGGIGKNYFTMKPRISPPVYKTEEEIGDDIFKMLASIVPSSYKVSVYAIRKKAGKNALK